MLLLALAVSLAGMANYGCNATPQDNVAQVPGTELDSVKILRIIAFRDSLVARADERQKKGDLNPSIFDDKNRFDYLTWEDGTAMYHGRFVTDTSEVRTMFFIKDGQVVNTNYRAFLMKPVRLAKEAMLYYDENGKLFFVEEHSMLLHEDEMPALLKGQPFVNSQRPLEDWEAEVKPYEEKTFSFITEAIEKGG